MTKIHSFKDHQNAIYPKPLFLISSVTCTLVQSNIVANDIASIKLSNGRLPLSPVDGIFSINHLI